MKRLATLTLALSISAFGAFSAFATAAENGEHGTEAHEHATATAAEGHGEHEENEPVVSNWFDWSNRKPAPFGFALINFAIFAIILYKLAGKPLREFVANRHANIRKDLDEASRLHKEAQEKLAQFSARIAGIDAEIDALLKQIKQEAETEKANMIAAAENQAKRLKDEAGRQVDAEIDAARRELRRIVVEAATKAAEAMLTGKLTADDQKRLAERYVAELDSTKRPNA